MKRFGTGVICGVIETCSQPVPNYLFSLFLLRKRESNPWIFSIVSLSGQCTFCYCRRKELGENQILRLSVNQRRRWQLTNVLHPAGTSVISDWNETITNFCFNTSLWANTFAVNCLETIHKYLIHLSINSKLYYIVLKVGMLRFLAK